MHIPDGFLSLPVSLGMIGVTSIVGVISHRRLKIFIEKDQSNIVPLMGCSAGFIFAAQMLNFPILAGTSGHFLGAAFATSLFGPFAAFFILSCVLVIQALFFADGGLVALGANIFCMGFVAPWSFQIIRQCIEKVTKNSKIALFLGAWASVFFASLACSFLLALSGTAPLHPTLFMMGSVHALIGIGEGLITASALLFLQKANVVQVLETKL